jgi:hypothetical protein
VTANSIAVEANELTERAESSRFVIAARSKRFSSGLCSSHW